MKKINTLFLTAVLFSSFLSPGAPLANAGSANPTLFVHGFNPFGTGINCVRDWAAMESYLTSHGFSGQKITYGYYEMDKSCDVNLVPHGSMLTSIEDISNSLAWEVYNNFSQNNVSVDLVGHSMGGLIIRYALYRVSIGDTTYPPFLKVDHVITLATPHEGYSLLAESCHLVPTSVQCVEMAPYSSFIAGLKVASALLPQGQGGTLWTNVGSNADPIDNSDGVVGSSSATSMEIPVASKLVMPWYKLIFHTKYTNNQTIIQFVANALGGATSVKAQVLTSAKTQVLTRPADVQVSRHALVDRENGDEQAGPAHIEPYLIAGAQYGVQFSSVQTGGVFDQMGIQNGDVVHGCAGSDLNQPFDALEAIQQNGGGSLQLCILRNASEITRVVAVQ